jgi:regulator of RNase E activity RraA
LVGDTAGQSALHASGAVAVFPNDVIVGDIDGIVVIPHQLAEEIAVDAAEQESLEEFIFKRIEAGAPLTGTYPPNEATKEAYVVWKRQNVSGNATAVR